MRSGRRSPQGERGLKYVIRIGRDVGLGSFPARGTWIEIAQSAPGSESGGVVPRKGNVD